MCCLPTGRGKVKVRARCEIEDMPNTSNRQRIIVTEIPYMVNKARLVETIANLVKDKRVEGISDVRDESSREGMRVVIECKRDANAQVILNQLYNYTQLQDTCSMNHLALVPIPHAGVDKVQPKVLSLREIIDWYITFQKDVVARRVQFDLNRAAARAHILEGLRSQPIKITLTGSLPLSVRLVRRRRQRKIFAVSRSGI